MTVPFMSISLHEKRIEKENFRSQKMKCKRIVEALLFSTSKPLSPEKLSSIISSSHPTTIEDIREVLSELQEEYEKEMRSFELVEKASGFLIRTRSDFSDFVSLLHGEWQREKLSKAATEVLAIIAHRCPITRASIEKIRGVDSSQAIASLLQRGLIEIVGRMETPGRPPQYGITRTFLDHFGLKNVEELRGPLL